VRREGLALVGGTPEQVHKLLEPGGPDAPRRLFDLILIDEASQMDVAHAILPLRGLAEGGAVVLAGDNKQKSGLMRMAARCSAKTTSPVRSPRPTFRTARVSGRAPYRL
jgi:hypothetical protein